MLTRRSSGSEQAIRQEEWRGHIACECHQRRDSDVQNRILTAAVAAAAAPGQAVHRPPQESRFSDNGAFPQDPA